jgi:hypothetical protein
MLLVMIFNSLCLIIYTDVQTGGQAFMVKLRRTMERSPSSMIIEPPHTLNGSVVDHESGLRWRHMKYAFFSFTE